MHLVVGGDEALQIVLILYRVSRKQNVLAVRTENRKQRILIARLCCCYECRPRFFG